MTWAVPVSPELLNFPVEETTVASLLCDSEPGGLLDCAAPPSGPLCTNEQAAWLDQHGTSERNFKLSVDGSLSTGDVILRDVSDSGVPVSIDSVESALQFTPVVQEFVLVSCQPYPFNMGAAAAPSVARAIQVPLSAGPVLFGEENPYGDTTTMAQPMGTPVVINLRQGQAAAIQPRLEVPGTGYLSGRLSMTVTRADDEFVMEAPLSDASDEMLILPSVAPHLKIQGGTLCPNGAAPVPPACTVDELLEQWGFDV